LLLARVKETAAAGMSLAIDGGFKIF